MFKKIRLCVSHVSDLSLLCHCWCLQVEVKVAQTKEALAMQSKAKVIAQSYGTLPPYPFLACGMHVPFKIGVHTWWHKMVL